MHYKIGDEVPGDVTCPGIDWVWTAPGNWMYYPQTAQKAQMAGPSLFNLLEHKSSAERKEYPVKTGVIDYFRDALFRVAKVSYDGNQKHNPGQPTHWARGKSNDHQDCCARHLFCNEAELDAAECAWRALAHLQLLLEKKYNIAPPPGCK